jgi:hypothetical protein
VIQYVTRKSIFSNNIPENASQFRLGLIDGGLIPEPRQIIARCKAFSATTDEGDSDAIIWVFVRVDIFMRAPLIVGHKPFQGIDGDPLIRMFPTALKFTRGRADIATDQREGTFFFDGEKGPLIVPVGNVLYITPDVNACGASALTGGCALIRGIFTHYALGR